MAPRYAAAALCGYLAFIALIRVWRTTVISHTWIAAPVLVGFALAAGLALQQVAPQARSIGAVVQAVSGSTPR